jgi:hypothetical protein
MYFLRCFLNEREAYLPVTNMFDDCGEELQSPDEVARAVAKLPDGRWLATECTADEIITIGRWQ